MEEATDGQTAPQREPLNFRKFYEHLQSFRRNITVEPVAFLILSSSVLAAICTQKLSLEKACRVNLNFKDEICDSLMRKQSGNHSQYERQLQIYVTHLISWKTIAEYATPSLVIIFLGAWSDLTGRRIIILTIPIVAHIFQCISNILNVWWFNELPVEVLMFLDASFHGIGGGWSLVFVGIFSYISDITTANERTYRLGYVNFSAFVSVPIGFAMSGFILKNTGYYGVYGFSIMLHSMNLIYVLLKLKDPQRSNEQKMHDNRGLRYFLRTFFDLSNIRDTIKVVFKSGPNQRRLRMCAMMLVVAILFGPLHGEMSVIYMNTRYRFNWDEVKFSIFQTYNFVTHTIGTIFSITVFSKYLQWHDSILGIISTVSKIAASFVYCFAPNDKIFFIAPLVEILNGTSLLAMRSIVSKLVAPNELGKVNSIFGLTENLMPLLYVPLYTNVYKATMEDLPGAVFLMGAAMTIPAILFFVWLLYEHRKEKKTQQAQGTELPAKETLLSETNLKTN